METLNEQDLEYLTKVENKLIRMRKREAANSKSMMMTQYLDESINSIDDLRGHLAARMGVECDTMSPKTRW